MELKAVISQRDSFSYMHFFSFKTMGGTGACYTEIIAVKADVLVFIGTKSHVYLIHA